MSAIGFSGDRDIHMDLTLIQLLSDLLYLG